MARSEKDIKDAFDEFLDESYKPYNVLNPGDPYDRTGIMLYPSSILKNTDPIAYQSFLNDWADRYDMYEEDETDETDETDDPYTEIDWQESHENAPNADTFTEYKD